MDFARIKLVEIKWGLKFKANIEIFIYIKHIILVFKHNKLIIYENDLSFFKFKFRIHK